MLDFVLWVLLGGPDSLVVTGKTVSPPLGWEHTRMITCTWTRKNNFVWSKYCLGPLLATKMGSGHI